MTLWLNLVAAIVNFAVAIYVVYLCVVLRRRARQWDRLVIALSCVLSGAWRVRRWPLHHIINEDAPVPSFLKRGKRG